jgi:hypothetical protein
VKRNFADQCKAKNYQSIYAQSIPVLTTWLFVTTWVFQAFCELLNAMRLDRNKAGCKVVLFRNFTKPMLFLGLKDLSTIIVKQVNRASRVTFCKHTLNFGSFFFTSLGKPFPREVCL